VNLVLVQIADAINAGDFDHVLSNISPHWFGGQSFEYQPVLESFEFDAQHCEDQAQKGA
jgi:hypothetical protein